MESIGFLRHGHGTEGPFCTYAGRPAVLDTVSRVFYTCATHTRAREWARELNEGK